MIGDPKPGLQMFTGDDALNAYAFERVVVDIPAEDSIPIKYLAAFNDPVEADAYLAKKIAEKGNA